MSKHPSKRPYRSARAIALSFRPVLSRAGLAVLLAASLGLLVASRSHNNVTQALRGAISDTVIPVVGVLAKPLDALSAGGRWISEMARLREDNALLISNNSRLLKWQAAATELSSENQKLRALLKFAPGPEAGYITARVATDTSGPYSRSVIVTSGTNAGIREDSAVVGDGGLAGRVVDAGKKTARVLLLTDINSRIPVLAQDSREHSIAAGNNGETLSLIYAPENSKLKLGEKIITSGDGGVMPAGLLVGEVSKIEKNVITVTPFVDSYHLEYVSVFSAAK